MSELNPLCPPSAPFFGFMGAAVALIFASAPLHVPLVAILIVRWFHSSKRGEDLLGRAEISTAQVGRAKAARGRWSSRRPS